MAKTMAAALTLLFAAIAWGQVNPTTSPGPVPTPPAATSVAAAPAPADPAVTTILNRLDEAGKKYPNLIADLHYLVDMTQLGDTEERTGKVYWQAEKGEEPPRFHVHFDTKKMGEGRTPNVPNVEDYVFDGQWLTIRKETIKQMTKQQVAAPGEKRNALQLGEGPFLVPFGQKAESVLKLFLVTTRPPQATDPANTDYLKLVTRPERSTQSKVRWAELWVAKDTGLPVRIVTQDTSENLTTVDFTRIQMPADMPKGTFDLPQPPHDWEYRVTPYQGNPNP